LTYTSYTYTDIELYMSNYRYTGIRHAVRCNCFHSYSYIASQLCYQDRVGRDQGQLRPRPTVPRPRPRPTGSRPRLRPSSRVRRDQEYVVQGRLRPNPHLHVNVIESCTVAFLLIQPIINILPIGLYIHWPK
jgi:hypothetical protein